MSWLTEIFSKMSGQEDIDEGYEGAITNIQQGMNEGLGYLDEAYGEYQQYSDFGKKYGLGGLESMMTGGMQGNAAYEWRMDQGLEAINRKASATGYSGSGNVLYELMNYGQGAASQEYGAEWERRMGLAGMGYQASGAQANVKSNKASLRYQGAQDIASLQAGKGRDIGGMKYDWMRNERSYLHDFGMEAWSGFTSGGMGGGGG